MATLPPSDKNAMDQLFSAVLKTTNDHKKITKAVESNMKKLSKENQTELTPILAEMQKDDMNKGGSLGGNGNQGGYNYSYGGNPLGVSVGPLVNFFENKAAAYGLDMQRLKDLQIGNTVSPSPGNNPTIINNNPANQEKEKPTTPNSQVDLILSVDENKNITIDVHSVKIGSSTVQVGDTKEKIIELISGNTQEPKSAKSVGGYKKTMKMRRNRRKHKKSKRIHHNKMGKI